MSRILLVRSKPGKQRGLGLKSRVFPAHLFVRLFSACHVSDGTDSRKTRPNHFRSGQDTSDQLLPPVDFTNFSCTRASLFRRLDRRYALADAENGSPYGDRAVHAADSRSVLRLDAIYDPLRPVGLGIGGALHPHRPEARRTSDTPVVHRVESPPSQVGRFGFAAPKTASSTASVKTMRHSRSGMPSIAARSRPRCRPSSCAFGEGERVFRQPGSPVGHTP